MKTKKERKGFLAGLVYGLVPHAGCIAFVLFSVLGATTTASLFKPLLLNSYFFYGLISLSLVFSTFSALLYLRKHNALSKKGIMKRWKYLTTLYGTTIAVSLIMFLVVFPLTANATTTQATKQDATQTDKITLKVNIPCLGHATLISDELYKLAGIINVKFRLPNYFDVSYDQNKITEENILSADIFNEYPASLF